MNAPRLLFPLLLTLALVGSAMADRDADQADFLTQKIDQPAPRRKQRAPNKPARKPATAKRPTPVQAAMATLTSPEIVSTDEYVDFHALDPVDENLIQWDPSSAKFVYVSPSEAPYLFLTGVLKPGYEISFGDRFVPLQDLRFQIKVSLPTDPRIHRLKLFAPDRTFSVFRIAHFWLKLPPAYLKLIEGKSPLIQRALGFSVSLKGSPFVQLYATTSPTTTVDLDSLRHASLTFRFFPPLLVEPGYDGWRLTIRDSRNNLAGEVAKFGRPPPYIEWKSVASKIHAAGTYTYRLNLYKDETVYEGVANTVSAVEGSSVLAHPYLPTVQLDPRAELGYYAFRIHHGVQYSGFFLGVDMPLTLYNRILIRGSAIVSLHSLDPQQNITFLRIGAGFRLYGHGDGPIFGRPHIYRIDILFNQTGFTAFPTAAIRRYTQFSVLVEPNLVLWGHHYVVPWLEFATRSRFEQQRLSTGLNYYFFVRPWSVKLGLGFAFDWLYHFQDTPLSRYTLLRTHGTIAFVL